MRKYLLPHDCRSYKANMHCHSTVSDGKFTPQQLKSLYMEKGYSIVAFTDHEKIVPQNELSDDDFLALTAYEVAVNDGNPKFRTTHLNFYASDKNNVFDPCAEFARQYTPEGINALIKAGREAGFLVSYNHPCWSLQTRDDYKNYRGMNFVEVWNSVSAVKGMRESEHVYDEFLRDGLRLNALAADDTHGSEELGRGWVIVKAPRLEYGCVVAALERGEYYSSTGPEIIALYLEDGKIHIECSPSSEIYLKTNNRNGGAVFADEKPVTHAEFALSDKLHDYFRLTVMDGKGRCAWTNAYYIEDIM